MSTTTVVLVSLLICGTLFFLLKKFRRLRISTKASKLVLDAKREMKIFIDENSEELYSTEDLEAMKRIRKFTFDILQEIKQLNSNMYDVSKKFAKEEMKRIKLEAHAKGHHMGMFDFQSRIAIEDGIIKLQIIKTIEITNRINLLFARHNALLNSLMRIRYGSILEESPKKEEALKKVRIFLDASLGYFEALKKFNFKKTLKGEIELFSFFFSSFKEDHPIALEYKERLSIYT